MAVDSVSNGNQEQPQKLLLHGWHPDWSGARSQPAPMSHGTVSIRHISHNFHLRPDIGVRCGFRGIEAETVRYVG